MLILGSLRFPSQVPRQQTTSNSSSVTASQTTTTTTSTAVAQPTPILVFNSLSQLNTCAPAVITWNYAGPIEEEVSLYLTNVNVTQEPNQPFDRQQVGGYNFVFNIATVLANSTNYTWNQVDIPQGVYNLTASSAQPSILLAVVSQTISITNGTDTSCLPSPTSGTTPTTFASPSHVRRGAIAGGVAGGVAFFIILFFVFFFARAARRKKLSNENFGRRAWGGLQSVESHKFLKEQPVDRARTRTSSRTSFGFGFGGKASDGSADDVVYSPDEKIVSTLPFNAGSPKDQVPIGLPPLPFQDMYPPAALNAGDEEFNPYNFPIREEPRSRANTLSSIPAKPPAAFAHVRHTSVPSSASITSSPTRRDIFATYSDNSVEMVSLPSSPTDRKPPRRVRTPRKPVPKYEGVEEDNTPPSSYNDASVFESNSIRNTPTPHLSFQGAAGSDSLFGNKTLHYLIPDPPPTS
jgi:hypothetical protein